MLQFVPPWELSSDLDPPPRDRKRLSYVCTANVSTPVFGIANHATRLAETLRTIVRTTAARINWETPISCKEMPNTQPAR